MITRGCHHLQQPIKRQATPIIFFKYDNDGVLFPYNDVVVVMLNIENYDVCLILIDNGTLVDVLYYDAILKIEISPKWLT